MANVKNFGLVGVGTTVQYGKGGPTLTGTPLLGLSADGTAAFKVPVGNDAQRPAGADGMIRASSQLLGAVSLEYYNGTDWVTLAVGGDTAAIQAEVDNIEAALGPAIDNNGNFVPAGFTGPVLTGADSFTSAIQQVADAIEGGDTLDEIFPPTAPGNIIYANPAGDDWLQGLPGLASGVQAWDAGLSALAAKTTTGILVQTGAETYASRTLVPPTEGITITNADGVVGNPTLALANDLAALEALQTFGYVVRTGDGIMSTRNITGTAGNIIVSDPDGVLSDSNVDLAPVVNPGDGGTFVKITTDGFGRVTNSIGVVTADITALTDSQYLRLDGTSTMAGTLNMGSNLINGVSEPVASSDAATKNYVDNAITGLSWKASVRAGTNINTPLATPGATMDGVTLVANDRVLLIGQTAPAENGIYIWTGAAVPLTRSADADTGPELVGASVFIREGAIAANSGWVQTTPAPITIGTSPITWVQFSGAGAMVGTPPINVVGNLVSLNYSGGGLVATGGALGLDLATGTALSIATNQLTLNLDPAGALDQTGGLLRVNAASVTNAMLVNQGFTLNADTGTSAVNLGSTLLVNGDAPQGVFTNIVAPGNIRVTVDNATTASKGVASFTATQFVVTAGNVAIGQVPPTSLPADGTITFGADTGDLPVDIALGQQLNIIGADTAITTVLSGTDISIQLETVDVAHGGTGLTSVVDTQVLYGGPGNTVVQSAGLAFNGTTNTLSLGSSTIESANVGGDLTVTTTTAGADINLMPGTGGAVVVGPAGGGVVTSDSTLTVSASTGLTVTGATTSVTSTAGGLLLQSTGGGVTLTSGAGDIDFNLAAPGAVLHITTPTAALYEAAVTDLNDIPNKKYVDDAIAAGGGGVTAGAVKAVKAVITLGTAGAQNIGAPLPVNSTVLRVKVSNLTDSAGDLVVGGGANVYMSAAENDLSATGIYISELFTQEPASTQVTATVTGGGTGTAWVIVEYQNA